MGSVSNKNVININEFLDVYTPVKSNTLRVYEKLMHNYEINKLIYTDYTVGSFKPLTSNEVSDNIYHKLLLHFYILYSKVGDIRYLNTAYKISAHKKLFKVKIEIF